MDRTRDRIVGYDLARALAILGMIIVNYEVVLGAGRAGPRWLVWLVGLLEGRAAATFVILAGVGLSLRLKRARQAGDAARISRDRRTLWKRALFLFVVGLLYSPLWPADILHFYALYIVVGSLMFTWSDGALAGGAGFFAGGFVLMLLVFDYEAGWNWDTLHYAGFWTPAGMTRHLLFNGFHPVFPWAAFLIAGMWLGRQDLTCGRVRRRIVVAGTSTVVIAESLSWLLLRLVGVPALAIDTEMAAALLGTEPMPPMPLYLLSAGGAAVAGIALCTELAERCRDARWVRPVVATGQLALTLYVAHVVIGMGLLEALGLLRRQSLAFALGYALAFYATGVLFAALWARRFSRGPLESIMRRLT